MKLHYMKELLLTPRAQPPAWVLDQPLIEPPCQPWAGLAQPTTPPPSAAAAAQHARAPAAATHRRIAAPCRQCTATSQGERKPHRRRHRPGFAWWLLLAAARRMVEGGVRGAGAAGVGSSPATARGSDGGERIRPSHLLISPINSYVITHTQCHSVFTYGCHKRNITYNE